MARVSRVGFANCRCFRRLALLKCAGEKLSDLGWKADSLRRRKSMFWQEVFKGVILWSCLSWCFLHEDLLVVHVCVP